MTTNIIRLTVALLPIIDEIVPEHTLRQMTHHLQRRLQQQGLVVRRTQAYPQPTQPVGNRLALPTLNTLVVSLGTMDGLLAALQTLRDWLMPRHYYKMKLQIQHGQSYSSLEVSCDVTSDEAWQTVIDQIPGLAQTPIKREMVSSEIPPLLYQRLRSLLLECVPFEESKTLADLFVDSRIAIWRGSLPQTDTLLDRVEQTVQFLIQQHHEGYNQNGLVLFLQVLRDRIDWSDECYELLTLAADELAELVQHK